MRLAMKKLLIEIKETIQFTVDHNFQFFFSFFIFSPEVSSTKLSKVKILLIWAKLSQIKYNCDRLQENRAQRGTLQKIFFCTYRVVGVQILSSPSFIVVA